MQLARALSRAVVAGRSPGSTLVSDPCDGLTAVATTEVAACALYVAPWGAIRCVRVNVTGDATCNGMKDFGLHGVESGECKVLLRVASRGPGKRQYKR